MTITLVWAKLAFLFVGLTDDKMARTVLRAAEQAGPPTLSPVLTSTSTVEVMPEELFKEILPSQLTDIASTSTIEEAEEMPELQEIQPGPLPIITSIATVEEIIEMPDIKQAKRTPTPVPTSINTASETLLIETDDHFMAPDLKVEDPDSDIDISAEQLEGGEDLELGDYSPWQNEVKLLMSKPENCLLIADCFLVRGRKRRMMKRRTGATRKA